HILNSFNPTSLQNRTKDYLQGLKSFSESIDQFITDKTEELARLDLPVGDFPERLGQAYFDAEKNEVPTGIYSSLALSQVNSVL
ncbi:hypothetical protein, partial [Stenotrophomonas maltophilia]|uniref:hypothetical protein n=1 Tax=Stenotrophomonas maltophilia TaxID=40324 RepID=UPI001953B1C8